MKILKTARKKHPFHVVSMETSQFVSTSDLEATIDNRKEMDTNEQVEWLKMKHIHFTKEKSLVLIY